LDIATVELQGLQSPDYFLEDGEVYFERVLGSMQAISLPPAVWTTSSAARCCTAMVAWACDER